MRLRRLDVTVSPYLYIAPFFIVFLGFGLFPLAYTFYVSLNHWELGATTHDWVGFRNYTRLLADPYFWNALRNTGSIWVLSTVPQLLAALGLAHVLNRRLRFRTMFRVGILAPRRPPSCCRAGTSWRTSGASSRPPSSRRRCSTP